MSDIKLRQLEHKAIERVRQAFSALRDHAVLPSTITAPIGEVPIDSDVYTFELRVTLKSGEQQ